MGTVVNLPNRNANEVRVSLERTVTGFTAVLIRFPDARESLYAMFNMEGDLHDVTVNTFLFQLNGIFLEQSNDFATNASIGAKMVFFFREAGVSLADFIYNEDGSFIDAVYDLLMEQVPQYIDLLYPPLLN